MRHLPEKLPFPASPFVASPLEKGRSIVRNGSPFLQMLFAYLPVRLPSFAASRDYGLVDLLPKFETWLPAPFPSASCRVKNRSLSWFTAFLGCSPPFIWSIF